MRTSWPVLIAGGGPSGLATAIELGRAGIECCVVEPRETVSADRPRAKTTSVRTMELLRRWGLADRVRAAAPLPVSYAQDVVFCTSLVGREIVRFSEAFGLTTSRREEFAECGQQAPQPVVEQVLRDAVDGIPGVSLLLGWRVEQIADGPETVQVTLIDLDGRQHRISADYLLGCDGGSGLSRAAIGGAYEGSSGTLSNLSILFRAPALDALRLCAVGVHYWIVGGVVGGLMGRLDLDGTWWAIVQGLDGAPASDRVEALVRGLIGADVELDVLATDPWSARMLIADRYRGSRVFLVGDAAHLNPPWGGHGFNTCVGDAVNIGWKLAAVLQGWADPALLDSYADERRPVAERTIAAAAAQDAFLAGSFAGGDLEDAGPAADTLRHELGRALQVKDSEFHSLGLVLGYDYPASSVVVPDGGTVPAPDLVTYTPSGHPGARLPHAWLPGDRSVFDLLGPWFTLLRLDPGVDAAPFVQIAQDRGIPLAVVDLSELPELSDRYGAALLLVRPDQHVAWRGSSAEVATEVLATVVGLVESAAASTNRSA